jgi:hypothetical protein
MNVHGNWDCGREIPLLGIFVSNLRYWFFAVCGAEIIVLASPAAKIMQFLLQALHHQQQKQN